MNRTYGFLIALPFLVVFFPPKVWILGCGEGQQWYQQDTFKLPYLIDLCTTSSQLPTRSLKRKLYCSFSEEFLIWTKRVTACFNSSLNVPCYLLTGIILCMSSENLQVFLQSAYDLSLTSGQHAFFLVHTHHQLNPDVFTDLIGQGNQTSEEMISAMEALFILVPDSSCSKTTVQVKWCAQISLC